MAKSPGHPRSVQPSEGWHQRQQHSEAALRRQPRGPTRGRAERTVGGAPGDGRLKSSAWGQRLRARATMRSTQHNGTQRDQHVLSNPRCNFEGRNTGTSGEHSGHSASVDQSVGRTRLVSQVRAFSCRASRSRWHCSRRAPRPYYVSQTYMHMLHVTCTCTCACLHVHVFMAVEIYLL